MINSNGYFEREGRLFVPVGVNYWPASCGVEMWREWPEDEIRADLDLLRELGLNTIRFFLRWPDFQLAEGRLDEQMLERLVLFLRWCEDRRLAAMPTLFVGFMSGATFWPAFKKTNLFGPEIRSACRFYTNGIARAMASHENAILAVDQGNELNCLPDSPEAGPEAIESWSADFCEDIRRHMPSAHVMSGLDHHLVCGERGWRLDNQAGCDCLSVHGYPVSPWWPVPIDGLTDPFCRNLLPLCARIARAYGPVMVQEFGTIATFSPEKQKQYLESVLSGTCEAGANGWLWWCLRDVQAPVHPYTKYGMEQFLGLVDSGNRVKPGLEGFIEFAKTAPDKVKIPREAGRTGIYWPRHPYELGDEKNPGNNAEEVFACLAVADAALRQSGKSPRIVRGDKPLPDDISLLLVAGASLDGPETDKLTEWVRSGGRLVIEGLDFQSIGPALAGLIGAVPIDYRKPVEVQFSLHGLSWTASAFLKNVRLELEPREALVIAGDTGGIPVALENELGAGRVTTIVPTMSRALLNEPRSAADWYGRLTADSEH